MKPDCQEWTARNGQPGMDSQERTARKRLPGEARQVRTLPGRDSRGSTARTRQPEQNRTAMQGQACRYCHDDTARQERLGQDSQDRTCRTGQDRTVGTFLHFLNQKKKSDITRRFLFTGGPFSSLPTLFYICFSLNYSKLMRFWLKRM